MADHLVPREELSLRLTLLNIGVYIYGCACVFGVQPSCTVNGDLINGTQEEFCSPLVDVWSPA